MYLTQGLHRSVQCAPHAPATIFGARVRTFVELADRVARLAGALRTLGVRDGERTGILALNSDRYVELLLAVPWAGGVLNPVNTRWSPAEIIHSLKESQTNILFVDGKFAPTVAALQDGHPGLDLVVHIGDGAVPANMLGYEDLIAGSAPVEDARRGADRLAALLYTGGTTGFPKGVMLSHANLLTAACGTEVTTQTGAGRMLIATPMFHVAALTRWLTHSLLGSSVVILPAFDPEAVMQAIERHRVQELLLVPAMMQMLVDHPRLAGHDLSSVRTLMYGASPITASLLARAMQMFPEARFTQLYGMTELAGAVTALAHTDHRDATRTRSAGRAASHAEVRVVDGNDDDVPRGTVGEIVCRGANVMLGYWNRPDETAKALRNGWMHTGDGAYMDDKGYVHIVDRMKDMIISGGENVYSTEVENAIAVHPSVAACAVIGVPDPQWGERVHAVIVPRPGCTTNPTEIREHCRILIAGYKVPRSCEFVGALPVSPAGKVLKHELRKPYWAGAERHMGLSVVVK
jgi:acyl-CoA synthetase (AMP-forming)/AMP-acid ligase II